MKQHEVVERVLKKLGGSATLPELYKHVLKDPAFAATGKTPEKNIMRILQEKKNLFEKIRTGMWGLKTYEHEQYPEEITSKTVLEKDEKNHSYYQGIFVEYGNNFGFDTIVPKNNFTKPYRGKTLEDWISLKEMHEFGYSKLVGKAKNVDVVWFHKKRKMPLAFIEIEHSTDFLNSLKKFEMLQDFYCRYVFLSPTKKRETFIKKLDNDLSHVIENRLDFIDFEAINDMSTIIQFARKIGIPREG